MPAPAPVVQLTEKLLIAAGGWEVLRHARALRETGKVSGAQWSPPVLQGSVQGEGREYRAGLKILSQSNVENLCTCRPSREYGTICAHSVAVGLSVLAGMTPVPVSPKLGAVEKTDPKTVRLPYQADPNAAARLHVIFAPDLAAAWGKGQLLVGLEVSENGKRGMFGSGNGKTLQPDDLRVVERLAAITGAVPGGMSILGRAQFLEMIDALVDHRRITLGRGPAVNVKAEAFRPTLQARFQPDESLEIKVLWPSDVKPLATGGRAWLLHLPAGGAWLQRVSPDLPAPYFPLLEEASRRLPREQAAAFLETEWPRLEPFFDLKIEGQAQGRAMTEDPVPEPPLFLLSLEGSLNQLGATLKTLYKGGYEQEASQEPERRMVGFPKDGPPRLIRTRNVGAERAAIGRLKRWGFDGPNSTHHYYLKGEAAILRFFALGLPALQKEAGWKVTVGTRFQNISKNIETITPEVAVRGSGQDWFEMEVSLTGSSGERFSAGEIQRLLQTGAGHTRLRNGKLAVLPTEMLNDLEEVLRDCNPDQSRPGVYRLDRSQGAYVDASLEKWGVAAAPSWQQWRDRQGGLRRMPDVLLPTEVGQALRPYQREGVRWLHLLAGNQLGGILADEMGLGKTLQALAFLASARGERPPAATGAVALQKQKLPSLVICPTSLVENWRREAAKFTPDLKTLAIDGPDRASLFAKVDVADLVITSYALLRRDLDRYRSRQFDTVILDEAHHIKNPDSQVAKAACALRSNHRFVLTGTPMENSVRDLWSILHFALPGYLGSRQDFRERYELPLSRPGEPAADAVRERLTRRLRPVLLRRLKRDVAKDLPARIEQTSFCDLTAAQAQVYAQLLEQSRRKLDDARAEKNAGRGRMLVLTALLRLRQACCDLRLLGLDAATLPKAAAFPDESDDPIEGVGAPSPPLSFIPHPSSFSSKLAMLDELMEEIREGGHRVLIFSQFVSMLKILSEHLEASKTPFCYLDGSTKPKDRTAQVERFQTDESVTAFLISVKAGGVGLNLTGADTVIHFDPWWNPAVEAQATDRAHRIGQTRVVTAYRLIARGTVEEKIFALQNRKKELTASLVEREKDEPLLETLSFEEIESLLE